MSIEKFFAIARERYSIKLKRDAGLSRPWSADPIFQNNRFCNVFREDDKTTQWFRENIRDPLDKDCGRFPANILVAIVAFRWFNKIETWENILREKDDLVHLFGKWDSQYIKYLIQRNCKPPYVTGAYIIKTPDGMNKVDGVLWCIDQFVDKLDKGDFDEFEGLGSTMQRTCELLQQCPYMGRFMSYQVVADAQHTQLLCNATDIYTWAQPGPGSTRGIGRVFYGDVDKFKYGSAKDEKEVIKLMRTLLEASHSHELWPFPRNMDMQTIQNMACETDKYYRAEEGGSMKRKFG